jgi:hypothetical protein
MIEVGSSCKAKGVGLKVVHRYRSSRETPSYRYLLESEDRCIKRSEFVKGSKASIFTVRRTILNNICIGESLFFSFKTF